MKIFNRILVLIFLTFGIYIILSGNKTDTLSDELKVYSLLCNNEYRYDELNNYQITYYTTKLINDKEYFLSDDNNKIILNNVVETKEKTIYKNKLLYMVTISFKLNEEISLIDAKLEISSIEHQIKLSVGNFIVRSDNKSFVDYSLIEGHYSYINNNLRLVGISLKLENDYIVNDIKVNDYSYVQIQNIKEEKHKLPSIIDNYDNNISDNSYGEYKLKANTLYFLPIGYSDNRLTGRFNLLFNNIDVLFVPTLHVTNPNINDYPSYIRSGEIVRNN